MVADPQRLHPTATFVGGRSSSRFVRNVYCFGVFKGQCWIVVALADKSLGIYTNGPVSLGNETPYELWQTIPCDDAVSCIAWCNDPCGDSIDQTLNTFDEGCCYFGCGVTAQIVLFKAKDSETGITWEEVIRLDVNSSIDALCLSSDGYQIVSGGSALTLWTKEYISLSDYSTATDPMFTYLPSTILDKQHQHQHGSPIEIVQFSADSRFFATTTKSSCLLKIWFKVDGERGTLYAGLDYIPLAHPRGIAALEWRLRSGNSEFVTSMCPQTIITLGKDDTIRVWQETDPNSERLNFKLVYAIPSPIGGCFKGIGWLRFAASFEGFHWCGINPPSTVTESVFLRGPGHLKDEVGLTRLDNPSKLVGGTMSNSRVSIDWLVAVNETGDMNMWAIEGLDNLPRRTVKVRSWVNARSRFTKAPLLKRKKSLDIFPDSDTSDSQEESVVNDRPNRFPLPDKTITDVTVLIPICTFTYNHNNHSYTTSKYPPSVFDISPQRITTMLWSQSLRYTFTEVKSDKVIANRAAWGITPGHCSEIIGLKTDQGSIVSTVDEQGHGIVWKYGSKVIAVAVYDRTKLLASTEISNNVILSASISMDKQLRVTKHRTCESSVVYSEEDVDCTCLLIQCRTDYVIIVLVSSFRLSAHVFNLESKQTTSTTLEVQNNINCACIVTSSTAEFATADQTSLITFYSKTLNPLFQFNISCPAAQLCSTSSGKLITLDTNNCTTVWQAGIDENDYHLIRTEKHACAVLSVACLNLGGSVDIVIIGSAQGKVHVYIGDNEFVVCTGGLVGLVRNCNGVCVVTSAVCNFVFVHLNMNMNDFVQSLKPLPMYHPSYLLQALTIGTETYRSIVSNTLNYVNQALQVHQTEVQAKCYDEPVPSHLKTLSIQPFALHKLYSTSLSKPKQQVSAASALFAEDPFPKDTTSQVTPLNGASVVSLLTQYSIRELNPREQLSLAAVFSVHDAESQESFKHCDPGAMKFIVGHSIFNCLPQGSKPLGMYTHDCLWALGSNDKSRLIEAFLPKNVTKWEDARALGVGLWVTEHSLCRTLAEEMAQTMYIESKRDPFESMLLYIAVGKKKLLCGLFKLAKQTNVCELLANDFTEERWAKAAVKNAFALIRSRRYIHAGNLDDAVNSIIQYKGDIQLALFIARIYKNENTISRLINETLIPYAIDTNDRCLYVIGRTVLGGFSTDDLISVLSTEKLPESTTIPFSLAVIDKNKVVIKGKQSSLHELLYLEEHVAKGHQAMVQSLSRYVLKHGTELPLLCLELLKKVDAEQVNKQLLVSYSAQVLYGIMNEVNSKSWKSSVKYIRLAVSSLFREDRCNVKEATMESYLKLCLNSGNGLSLFDGLVYSIKRDEESEDNIVRERMNSVYAASEEIAVVGLKRLPHESVFHLMCSNKVLVDMSSLLGVHIEYAPETVLLAITYISIYTQDFKLLAYMLSDGDVHYGLSPEACTLLEELNETVRKRKVKRVLHGFHGEFFIAVVLFAVVDKCGKKFAEESMLCKVCANQLNVLQKLRPSFIQDKTQPSMLFAFDNDAIDELWGTLKGPNQIGAVEHAHQLKQAMRTVFRIRHGVEAPSRYHFHESCSRIVTRNAGELFLSVAQLSHQGEKKLVLARNSRSVVLVNQSDSEESISTGPVQRSNLLDVRTSRSKRSPSPSRLTRRSSSATRFLSSRKGRSVSPSHRKSQRRLESLPSSEAYPVHAERGWMNVYESIGWRTLNTTPMKFVSNRGLSFSSHAPLAQGISLNETMPLCVAGHPYLPYYFTGGNEGNAYMWKVGSEHAVVEFEAPNSTSWLNRSVAHVTTTADGLKLAGSDTVGQISIWQIHDSGGVDYPLVSFVAHSKRTLDTIFLNNSTVLATSGKGSDSFCIWDTLLPPHSRRVAAINSPFNHSYSYYSLGYMASAQSIVIGDGHGDLSLFDMRQRTIIYKQKQVHHKAIRSIAIDPNQKYFATGSTDGSIKLWTLAETFQERNHLLSMHPTHVYVNQATSDSMVSQRGTTGLVFTDDFLYSCGADGTVKETPKFVVEP